MQETTRKYVWPHWYDTIYTEKGLNDFLDKLAGATQGDSAAEQINSRKEKVIRSLQYFTENKIPINTFIMGFLYGQMIAGQEKLVGIEALTADLRAEFNMQLIKHGLEEDFSDGPDDYTTLYYDFRHHDWKKDDCYIDLEQLICLLMDVSGLDIVLGLELGEDNMAIETTAMSAAPGTSRPYPNYVYILKQDYLKCQCEICQSAPLDRVIMPSVYERLTKAAKRHYMHNRYIEVYHGYGKDKICVGRIYEQQLHEYEICREDLSAWLKEHLQYGSELWNRFTHMTTNRTSVRERKDCAVPEYRSLPSGMCTLVAKTMNQIFQNYFCLSDN